MLKVEGLGGEGTGGGRWRGGGTPFGYASFSYPRIASVITSALSVNSFHTHMHMVLMWAAMRVGVAQQGLHYDMFTRVVPKAGLTHLSTCVREGNSPELRYFLKPVSSNLQCW